MIKYKNIKKVHTYQEVNTVWCDICGKKIPNRLPKDVIIGLPYITIGKRHINISDDNEPWDWEEYQVCRQCVDKFHKLFKFHTGDGVIYEKHN